MRPTANGTGDIGDGITMAVVGGGVIDEIGSVRQYNAVNPCDVGACISPAQSLALFPCANANSSISSMPDALYPMTFHQRHYLWPDTGIGEVRLAGSPSVDKSYPPKEVPIGQADWSTRPITVVPIIGNEIPPLTNLDTQTSIPSKCCCMMEFRTLRRDAPAPTVYIRNNQYGGDTRKWFLSGVTKDGSGTPLVSCRVVAMQTNKVIINIDQNANPIVADIVSSASDGSFLIQVPTNNYYWLIGYKSGAPDLAGSTINLVIPVDG
jgi:hypothetical protein